VLEARAPAPARDAQVAEATSTHWSHVAEVGSAQGILILFWVYRYLGRLPFQIALAPVALYFFLFKASQRRASREFLTRCELAGGSGRRPSAWRVLRHFFSFGEALLDKFVAWNGGIRFEDVSFHGYEALRAALEAGQGALLFGSHLGNLEVCRVLSQLRPGLKLRVLVHTHHASMFNRLLARLNPGSQVSLQQVTEIGVAEAAELSAWVAAGGVVLIAADRVPVAGGEGRVTRLGIVDFLGHPAPLPQGPFILASVLGCPVFLMFCLKRGRRFDAIFEPFAERVSLPRAERERALSELAARYARRLEAHCLGAPLQWFNFFPFWSQSSSLRLESPERREPR
jgi:predicted LPLAT superfamily acyltransferase